MVSGFIVGVKRVRNMTPHFLGEFACILCNENIAEKVEQQETLCNTVEMVTEFMYFGDKAGTSGGREAAATARTTFCALGRGAHNGCSGCSVPAL